MTHIIPRKEYTTAALLYIPIDQFMGEPGKKDVIYTSMLACMYTAQHKTSS